MIDKTGIFLPQSGLNSDAAQMLIQSIEGAEEAHIIDFKAPSQLASVLRRSDFGTAVVAAPEEIFLKTKVALLKAIGAQTVRSSAVTVAIGEECELGEKEIEIHSAIPVGAKSIITHDGLFSAFIYEEKDRKIIFLPLIESRLAELLGQIFDSSEDRKAAAGFRKSLSAIISSEKTLGVAPEGLSGALMAVVSSVEGGEEAFTLSPLPCQTQGENADAEYARSAKENTGADYGVSVSDICADSETGGKFITVCVADSERARLAKVFAEDGEDTKHLAGAAITKLCEMLEELAGAGALVNPDPPAKTEPKKNPILPIIIAAIGIAAAVIISLLVAMFAGGNDETQHTVAGNAYIDKQNAAVYAAGTEPETELTEPLTEEDFGFRGESGILDEIGLPDIPTDAVTEEASTAGQTATVAPTQAATKPIVSVTEKTTAAKTTKAPQTAAPTKPVTQKPTASATAQPVKPDSQSGTFVFTVYGWGHGVGMSQEGAISMAKSGKDYKQILAHYYPGTTLKADSSVPESVRYGGTDYGLVEYLCKTSYREIGNSAPKEAIKAQIVAVYTFAKTYNFDVDSSRHAFSAGWEYENTATHKACLEVLGMSDEKDTPKPDYVDYKGSAAFTCYFASSAGKTVSANSVWGGNYAYLSGGASSPETVEKSTFTVSSEDMKKMILAYDESIILGDDPSQWLKIVSHDGTVSSDTGYVSLIRVGNKEMRGNRFRGEVCGYKIRSHCFSIKYIPD